MVGVGKLDDVPPCVAKYSAVVVCAYTSYGYIPRKWNERAINRGVYFGIIYTYYARVVCFLNSKYEELRHRCWPAVPAALLHRTVLHKCSGLCLSPNILFIHVDTCCLAVTESISRASLRPAYMRQKENEPINEILDQGVKMHAPSGIFAPVEPR